MHDDDVAAAAIRCPDCFLGLEAASAAGVRYLICPECHLVRMLPLAAWTGPIDLPARTSPEQRVPLRPVEV